jgi:tRNA(Ile)-lysidine synthase
MARVVDQPAAVATLVRRVRRLLDDSGSGLAGRRVLALCSGGADSVALVALLRALPRGAAPRSLDVLFLDHALRDDVAAERACARAAAEHAGATFHELRCELRLVDDPRGVEAAARAWRLDEACRVAAALDADVACTGHTASDQLEQALLALVGVTGRGGDVDAMPVARPLDRERGDRVRLVRPLLALTRAQVEAACAELGLAWADDPTNADPDAHVRNAIRAAVVPALLDAHAGAGAAIARAGERRRSEVDATRALARALLAAWGVDGGRIDVRRLAPLDPAARRQVVAAWLSAAHPARDVGGRIVAAVDRLAVGPSRAACGGSRVDLPGAACVRRDGYDLVIATTPLPGGPP